MGNGTEITISAGDLEIGIGAHRDVHSTYPPIIGEISIGDDAEITISSDNNMQIGISASGKHRDGEEWDNAKIGTITMVTAQKLSLHL